MFLKKKTNQSIPSGDFETWMLIENTLEAEWESKRKEGKEITIKGSGMKINVSKTTLEDRRQQINIFKIA